MGKRIAREDCNSTKLAEDTMSELAGTSGGLRIGASSDVETGTFWSGLIDDVRIYDRVVTP